MPVNQFRDTWHSITGLLQRIDKNWLWKWNWKTSVQQYLVCASSYKAWFIRHASSVTKYCPLLTQKLDQNHFGYYLHLCIQKKKLSRLIHHILKLSIFWPLQIRTGEEDHFSHYPRTQWFSVSWLAEMDFLDFVENWNFRSKETNGYLSLLVFFARLTFLIKRNLIEWSITLQKSPVFDIEINLHFKLLRDIYSPMNNNNNNISFVFWWSVTKMTFNMIVTDYIWLSLVSYGHSLTYFYQANHANVQ